MKVFLLLAAVVCISTAQLAFFPENDGRQQCLCRRVRGLTSGMKSNMKSIQIYLATVFCDRVEIVVTTKMGLRYCLNPELKVVQRLLANVMQKQRTTTSPDESTSSPVSTDRARK